MEKKIKKDNEVILDKSKIILDDLYKRNNEFNEILDQTYTHTAKPSEVLFYTNLDDYIEELYSWKENQTKEGYVDVIDFLGPDGKNTLLELVQAIKRSRVAPFVGAGLCAPLKFPAWQQALLEIRSKLDDVELPDVEKYIEDYEYLEAAELLFNEDERTFKSFISDRFYLNPNISKIDLHIGALKYLPEIADGCVVTTNFDRALEELFKSSDKPFEGFMHGVQNKSRFVTDLIKGDRCLLKLHGNVGEEESYIFTKSQYNNAYGEELDFSMPLPKTLRQIFISHSLLFLGCSLEQDRTLELFHTVKKSEQFEIPQHFAILPKPGDPAVKRKKETDLREINIKTLWYPDGEHEYVELILKMAVDIANGNLKNLEK